MQHDQIYRFRASPRTRIMPSWVNEKVQSSLSIDDETDEESSSSSFGPNETNLPIIPTDHASIKGNSKKPHPDDTTSRRKQQNSVEPQIGWNGVTPSAQQQGRTKSRRIRHQKTKQSLNSGAGDLQRIILNARNVTDSGECMIIM